MIHRPLLAFLACLLAGNALSMTNMPTGPRTVTTTPDGRRMGTGVVASVNSNGTINIDGATYVYRPQFARVLDAAGRPMSRAITAGTQVNFTTLREDHRERIVEISLVRK